MKSDVSIDRGTRDLGNKALDDSFVEYRSRLKSLFIPTMLIAIGYGMLWLWLYFGGSAQTNLARLCMYVLILGVPLLLVYNLIRFMTVNIRIYGGHILAHKGFPARDPVDIPLAFIQEVTVNQGLFGRFTHLATVTIKLSAGKNIVISDVFRAGQLKSTIDEKLARLSE